MTEYEWETPRVPRPTRAEFLANHHHRSLRGVTEFAALEHPRESIGWILRQHSQANGPWSALRRLRPARETSSGNSPTSQGSRE